MPANIGGKTYSNGQLLIGGGLILSLINWFIPWWWGYSSSYQGAAQFGISGGSYSGGTNGFGLWSGILGFIVLLALIALFAIRTFAPNVLPALPVADWMIYTVGGVFIALMTVLFLTYAGGVSYSGPGYNFSSGISIGFFVGIVLALAVAVGGWLTKTEPQPATAPFTGFNQTPPPPAAGQ